MYKKWGQELKIGLGFGLGGVRNELKQSLQRLIWCAGVEFVPN